jgi:hypothetical protein
LQITLEAPADEILIVKKTEAKIGLQQYCRLSLEQREIEFIKQKDMV